MRRGGILVVALVAGAALTISVTAPILNGLSIDGLFWLRQLFAPVQMADSPTVVVAIDEETYRRAPFKDTPQALWTPQIAKVLDDMLASGATVVGFDIVLSTSVDPFLKGFEHDFLVALHRGAGAGRVVLGQIQQQEQPIVPFAGYVFAVGDSGNVRPLNLFVDPDGVIRRLPLHFHDAASDVPGMAAELAARAGVRRGDASPLLLNFDGDIPTYSLADLYACGNPDYFRQHFAGRIVLLGVALDVEDRKLASKRFITEPEGRGAPERCALAPLHDLLRTDLRRDTIPGVYIHATAINNILRADDLHETPAWLGAGLSAGLSGAAGIAVLGAAPPLAGAITALLLLGWVAGGTIAFAYGWVVPVVNGAVTMFGSFFVVSAYRFLIIDRERRRTRRAFALYLPSYVIDRMLAQERLPQLGGELRTVTVLFCDIAGFTEMSEGYDPVILVDEINRYFAAMSTIVIDAYGGYVDRYVGDAVLAMFGAPIDDADHARHAVEAALRMQATLAGQDLTIAGRPVRARIGINTGEALIGNIGSPLHFSYTAMGDTVNLASRIEHLNKTYGTGILVSAATALACGGAVQFRSVGKAEVAGRNETVMLYEPEAVAGTAAT